MRVRTSRRVLLGALVAGLLAACSSSNPAGPESPGAATTPVGPGGSRGATSNGGQSGAAAGVAAALRSDLPRGTPASAAAASQVLESFGAQLLGQLPSGDNGSISPYSIYSVLAMARAGAKGETARQLDAVLGGDVSVQGQVVTAVDAAVDRAVAQSTPPKNSHPEMIDQRLIRFTGGNSVWIQPGLPVHQEFLAALARGFGVGMYQLDFAADPEKARQAINSWVAERTDDLIRELLPPDVIDGSTVMALVNALRLSAPWAKEFQKLSAPMPFTTLDGRKTSVPMLSTSQVLESAAGKGWTSVSLPYKGKGLAMTLIVPDAGSFGAVRKALPSMLPTATSARATKQVWLKMPPFKMNTHQSIAAALQALGVTDIFGSAADLSGIAGQPGDLFVRDVVHQSVVAVDEKGTEAAAATAMVVEAASLGPEPTPLTVDRPFFFVIHHTVTGAPLFLGQVVDPTR